MGSKGTAASPPLAECCMCGDHGLTEELFRCKVCLVRSQHKYCSDLYPKAESYRACNWCLNDEAKSSKEAVTKLDTNSSNHSRGKVDQASISGFSGSGVKLRREVISPQLMNKPIKKLKMLERSASDITDHLRSEDLSASLGRSRKQVFRGKVRRYKLLEEVSS